MFTMVSVQIKDFLRDKPNIFFSLIFPVFLVFLLGNLLAFMDNSESVIGDIRFQYVIETENPADRAAVESFLDGLNENGSIRCEEADNLETAKSLASDNEITAAVLFKEPMEIEIFEGPETLKNNALQLFFTAFTKTANAASAVAETAPENLYQMEFQDTGSLILQKDLGINRSMLDYYAVTMVMMVMFMGGMSGTMALQSERKDHTLERLVLSPKNKFSLYIEKILASSIPQVFIQVIAVMIPSTLLFGAHYAKTWQDNLLLFGMFFVCGLAVVAVTGLIGIFLKINAMVILMPVIWVMMFVSGTFSKEVYFPGVTDHSPVYLMQTAAFDVTVFGRQEKAWTVLFVCMGVFVAVLLLGAYVFKKRGVKA